MNPQEPALRRCHGCNESVGAGLLANMMDQRCLCGLTSAFGKATAQRCYTVG